jgi:hypothetical protein
MSKALLDILIPGASHCCSPQHPTTFEVPAPLLDLLVAAHRHHSNSISSGSTCSTGSSPAAQQPSSPYSIYNQHDDYQEQPPSQAAAQPHHYQEQPPSQATAQPPTSIFKAPPIHYSDHSPNPHPQPPGHYAPIYSNRPSQHHHHHPHGPYGTSIRSFSCARAGCFPKSSTGTPGGEVWPTSSTSIWSPSISTTCTSSVKSNLERLSGQDCLQFGLLWLTNRCIGFLMVTSGSDIITLGVVMDILTSNLNFFSSFSHNQSLAMAGWVAHHLILLLKQLWAIILLGFWQTMGKQACHHFHCDFYFFEFYCWTSSLSRKLRTLPHCAQGPICEVTEGWVWQVGLEVLWQLQWRWSVNFFINLFQACSLLSVSTPPPPDQWPRHRFLQVFFPCVHHRGGGALGLWPAPPQASIRAGPASGVCEKNNSLWHFGRQGDGPPFKGLGGVTLRPPARDARGQGGTASMGHRRKKIQLPAGGLCGACGEPPLAHPGGVVSGSPLLAYRTMPSRPAIRAPWLTPRRFVLLGHRAGCSRGMGDAAALYHRRKKIHWPAGGLGGACGGPPLARKGGVVSGSPHLAARETGVELPFTDANCSHATALVVPDAAHLSLTGSRSQVERCALTALGPRGVSGLATRVRTGRGEALLSMGDVECNPGPGPSCPTAPLERQIAEQWEGNEGDFWFEDQTFSVADGPCGGSGRTSRLKRVVHSVCQSYLVLSDIGLALEHHCPAWNDNSRWPFLCPICGKTLLCTPRMGEVHRLKCIYDTDEDKEILQMEIGKLNARFCFPRYLQTQSLLRWGEERSLATTECHQQQLSGRGALLTCGDVEQNPGPKGVEKVVSPLDDYMLDPLIRVWVTQQLCQQGGEPTVDAFADQHNAQFPAFWSVTEDAFTRSWHGDRPLWMNPPFGLLRQVKNKLTLQGGHVILLVPHWSPLLSIFSRMSSDRCRLPRSPIYRVRGAGLLPTPQWDTSAFLIHLPSSNGQDSTGTSFLPPPTPRTNNDRPRRYCPYVHRRDLPSQCHWRTVISLQRNLTLLTFGGREFVYTGDHLWDIRGPSDRICLNCLLFHWPWQCSSLLQLHGARPPTPLPTFKIVPKGPGQAITQWTTQGRGALLTCGDVEENPGPGVTGKGRTPAKKRRLVDNVQGEGNVDLAHGGDYMDCAPTRGLTEALAAVSTIRPPKTIVGTSTISLLTVLGLHLSPVLHIPAGVNELFVTIMADLIEAYVDQPCEAGVFAILSLPKLALTPPAVKGEFGTGELEDTIRIRLRRFQAGEYDSLYADLKELITQKDRVTTRARSEKTGPALKDHQVRRLRTLVGEGAAAKAVQSLGSKGVHDPNDPEVVKRLQKLHPQADALIVGDLPSNLTPFLEGGAIAWEDLIRESIRKTRKGSAPGPSGLRMGHLQDALRRPGRGARLITAIAHLAAAWVAGQIPPAHSKFWCGANLTPLEKPDGGVRPVAVGETLRRLVGKALLKTGTARSQVAKLAPTQVGVGVANATESVAMGVQSLVRQLEGNWAVLQVDFSNAFNTMDRHHLLQQTQERAPALYNFMLFAYGEQAPLYCGNNVLWSQTGTHQGCPLGPVGFALGLQPLALKIRQECALVWGVWYLDDGILVGTPESVGQALRLLSEEAPQVGLGLNRKKCALWGPSAHEVPGSDDVPKVAWDGDHGLTVLGLPVDGPGGTNQTVKAWEAATEKLEHVTNMIATLADPQLAHHLLRACADGCRVNHLLRGSDSYAAQQQVHQCTEVIMEAFETAVGVDLSSSKRLQASMPLAQGGCGIKNPEANQPAARVSALSTFYTDGARSVGAPLQTQIVIEEWVTPVVRDLIDELGPNFDPLPKWQAEPKKITMATKEQRSQKWWGQALGKSTTNRLLDVIPPRDQARLLEQSNGIGHHWMMAPPCDNTHTVIPPDEYVLGMKWWLGLPVLQRDSVCPGCQERTDANGDHLLCCKHNNFANRHNAVQEALYSILSCSGQCVAKEVALANAPDTQLRPADLLLDMWQDGKPTAVDITVSHGWQVAEQGKVVRDKWRPFLRKREKGKHQKYDEHCTREGWAFMAFSMGTWGGMGPEAAKILSRIAQRAAVCYEGQERANKLNEVYQHVSLSLFRQIWKLLLNKQWVQ